RAGEAPALLDRAIEDYRRVLGETDTDGTVVASSPRHVGVRFDLAGFLLRQGKVAEAEREYRAVIALPGCPVALVGGAHYYLGEIALLGGNRAAAAAAYRAAYGVIPRTDPSKMPVAAKLASLLIDLKDLDGAAGVVEMALADGARDQEKLGLRMLEAKILDRRGDLSGAISVLARILDLDPNHAPALVTLAGIEASQGKHESAKGRYEAVLARDPGNIEALQGIQAARLLGEAGGGKGGADGAREAELRLLPTIHGRAVERLKRGELLAARDLFRDLLSRAVALGEKGRQAEAIRGIAAVEEKLGRSRTAEADLHKALELVPLDPDTHRQLGDLYLRTLGEPALARRHYDLYLESLPRGAAADPMVHYNLAGILEKAEPVRALGHLALARDGGHSSPSVDRRLGYLHAEAGQWEASLDAFNRYLEKAPPSSEKDQVKTFIKDSVLPRLSTQ
ncbi:MAG TPA: tetratricopeptide repeat protein, partial [Planctomycetota bacterium]|nr:tetratricopeptide repeat protein [Planctomycetota bacterium]